MLEINLRLDKVTGNLFGNINNTKTYSFSNFGKLLTLNEFCKYVIKNKIFDLETLEAFVNDEDRDNNALYAVTKDNKSIVWWNTKRKTAYAIHDSSIKEFQLISSKKAVFDAPDLVFKQSDASIS